MLNGWRKWVVQKGIQIKRKFLRVSFGTEQITYIFPVRKKCLHSNYTVSLMGERDGLRGPERDGHGELESELVWNRSVGSGNAGPKQTVSIWMAPRKGSLRKMLPMWWQQQQRQMEKWCSERQIERESLRKNILWFFDFHKGIASKMQEMRLESENLGKSNRKSYGSWIVY